MRKILMILAVLFAAVSFSVPAAMAANAATTHPAATATHATSELAALAQAKRTYEQFCIEAADWCLDAWNGGPAVNVYSSNGGANTLFSDITNSNPSYANFEFEGNGECIGDYGNSPSDARAGLVGGCGTSGIGWGGNFGTQFCANNTGIEMYNVHNQGWLGPQNSNGNGTAFYLNKPNPYCFIFG
jgi:hypothetical protein